MTNSILLGCKVSEIFSAKSRLLISPLWGAMIRDAAHQIATFETFCFVVQVPRAIFTHSHEPPGPGAPREYLQPLGCLSPHAQHFVGLYWPTPVLSEGSVPGGISNHLPARYHLKAPMPPNLATADKRLIVIRPAITTQLDAQRLVGLKSEIDGILGQRGAPSSYSMRQPDDHRRIPLRRGPPMGAGPTGLELYSWARPL